MCLLIYKSNHVLLQPNVHIFLINTVKYCINKQNCIVQRNTHSSFKSKNDLHTVQLQNKAISDPKNAASYYFKLANGLYNMTYYGNARNVYSSPIMDPGLVYFGYDKTPSSNAIFDCAKALEYYRKAMEASSNKEFKAKCCFMAAKCEQNQYFSSAEFNYDAAIQSGSWFKELRDNYSKTNYYQEIIHECGYFRMFLKAK